MTLREQLLGAWQLVAWKVRWEDSDDFTYPFGEKARGLIVYSDNGYMSAVIHAGDRASLPAGLGPKQMPAEACALAF